MGVDRSLLQPGDSRPASGFATPISPERLAEARAALRMSFLVIAPRRVTALRLALQTAAFDDGARRELQRLGHQMRGTAATVGLADLGLLGDIIERSAATVPFSGDEVARVTAAVALVEEYVARAVSGSEGAGIESDPRYLALRRAPR